MQVPLPGGYILSVVLNKGRYSTCLNPHIGICRPQRGGYMLRFPRHWIFDIEMNRARRRWLREQGGKLVTTKHMFGFPRSSRWRMVDVYDTGDGERRTRALYVRIPKFRTWVWRWHWMT